MKHSEAKRPACRGTIALGLLAAWLLSGCMGLSTAPNWRYTDPPVLSPERYPVQTPQMPVPMQSRRAPAVEELPPVQDPSDGGESAVPEYPLELPDQSVPIETNRLGTGEEGPDASSPGPQLVVPRLDSTSAVSLEVQMPRRRAIDSRFEVVILLRNRSDTPLSELAVEVQLSDGLELPGRVDRRIQRPIGALDPNQQMQLPLTLECSQMGELCATFRVLSDGIEIASTRACIDCIQPTLVVTGLGPSERTIGSRAEYQFRIVNPTDRPIDEVGLKVSYSSPLTPIAVSTGYTQYASFLSWDLGTLEPGETVQIEVEFECAQISDQCYVAVAALQSGDEVAQEELRLAIAPVSGDLDLQIGDSDDPIGLGGTSEVQVQVTNRGPAAMNGIRTSIRIPEELRVESVKVTSGVKELELTYKLQGQHLEFDAVQELAAGDALTYAVRLKALQPGDFEVVTSALHSSRTEPVLSREYLSVTPEPAASVDDATSKSSVAP